MTKTINEFSKITVDDLTFVKIIAEGARNVDLLRSESQKKRAAGARDALLDSAFSAGMQSLNAMLAVAKARCRRAAPPADIEAVTDTSGKLIYAMIQERVRAGLARAKSEGKRLGRLG